MSDVTYGFVDENNFLQEWYVVKDNDLETLERIKELVGHDRCYRMNLEKEVTAPGNTYWNGSRFMHPSPYPSWVFDEESNTWQPPIPTPFVEGVTIFYDWDEPTLSWKEVGRLD